MSDNHLYAIHMGEYFVSTGSCIIPNTFRNLIPPTTRRVYIRVSRHGNEDMAWTYCAHAGNFLNICMKPKDESNT